MIVCKTHRRTRRSHKLTLRIAATVSLTLVGSLAATAHAQQGAEWSGNGPDDKWSTSANWANFQAPAYPTNGGGVNYTVLIGSSEVHLDVPVTVDKVESNGLLRLDQNLTVSGPQDAGFRFNNVTGNIDNPNTATHTVNFLRLGVDAAMTGTYGLGGTATLNATAVDVGFRGTGSFGQSGGTANITSLQVARTRSSRLKDNPKKHREATT